MNLKEVYEIFYPGKCKENPSVWNVPPKYRSKKDFLKNFFRWKYDGSIVKSGMIKREEADFSDCKGETRYIASLRTFLFEQPWTISRIEGKANELLSGQICEKVMNESFLRFSDVMDITCVASERCFFWAFLGLFWPFLTPPRKIGGFWGFGSFASPDLPVCQFGDPGFGTWPASPASQSIRFCRPANRSNRPT